MDTTTTAPVTVTVADAVDETPRMLDTYALVYAFTLMLTVAALLALSQLRLYSYTPLYTTLMMLPP